MMGRGLSCFIDNPLIVLHLHELLLVHLLLVGCGGALEGGILLVRGVANYEVIDFGEYLHVAAIVHHYNVIIV